MVVSVLSVPVNVMTLSVTTDNLGVGTVAAADPALCCAVLCCAVLASLPYSVDKRVGG